VRQEKGGAICGVLGLWYGGRGLECMLLMLTLHVSLHVVALWLSPPFRIVRGIIFLKIMIDKDLDFRLILLSLECGS